jgi:glycosyltransferase involved in cell wall biosynthesis
MKKEVFDISVVAANYNNAPHLNAFIESIINSTVIPKELIIVDDGSTDNSIEIIETFSIYKFIKLIKLEKNVGFANALNEGIKLVTGKYIARIDPDDIIIPDRLEKQFNYLENNKEIDIVGGNVIYFNSISGKKISTSNFPETHNQILKAYQDGDHGLQHPTAFIKTDILKKYSYAQGIFPVEDYELFARIINDGYKFANINEPVNQMRVHCNSVSNNISYKTIKETFHLRESIFDIKNKRFDIYRYYKYIFNYRKFLFSQNIILKILYILIASVYYPEKVVKKLFSDKTFSIQLSYYLFLLLFIIDSTVNYFYKLPIFVTGGIILLFYNLELLRRFKQLNKTLLVIVISFVIIAIINNIVYSFHIKNISDLFFILLFVTSYYLYKNNHHVLTVRMILVFLFGCLFLIIPSFFGINTWNSTIYMESNDLEFLRLYNQGLYRIPHIGSYFFGFLSLFFGFQYSKTKKNLYLGLAILTFFICFYIGVRTFLVAAILSAIIFLIVGKYWKVLIIPSILIILSFIFIDNIIEATRGTFVFQYFTMIKTTMTNFSRLSRITIWASWYKEMSEFGVIDYLIGKTFIASHYANEINIKFLDANIISKPKGLWFHSDFFSIIFSYGIWTLGLYIYFFIKIFRDFKVIIKRNFFIFTFYFSIVFSAFINGMYFYFPVFLLVPFVYMLTHSNNKIKLKSLI